MKEFSRPDREEQRIAQEARAGLAAFVEKHMYYNPFTRLQTSTELREALKNEVHDNLVAALANHPSLEVNPNDAPYPNPYSKGTDWNEAQTLKAAKVLPNGEELTIFFRHNGEQEEFTLKRHTPNNKYSTVLLWNGEDLDREPNFFTGVAAIFQEVQGKQPHGGLHRITIEHGPGASFKAQHQSPDRVGGYPPKGNMDLRVRPYRFLMEVRGFVEDFFDLEQ
jgi:hypothetical protein